MVPKAFLGLAGLGVLSLVGLAMSGKNKMSDTKQNDLQIQREDFDISVDLGNENDNEKKDGWKAAEMQDVGSDKSLNDKEPEKEPVERKREEKKLECGLTSQGPNQISEAAISENEARAKKSKFKKPDFNYDAMQDFVVTTEDEAADGKTD